MVFAPVTWQKVCADPQLQDLPYRIELNRFNQIVMSPVNPRRSELCNNIARRIEALVAGGQVLIDLAMETADRIKVPDVAWSSLPLLRRMPQFSAWTEAPEICVEVLSPSNTAEEMRQKRVLYFERGAQEVWLCTQKGALTFFLHDSAEPEGRRSTGSKLCPKFPARIRPRSQ